MNNTHTNTAHDIECADCGDTETISNLTFTQLEGDFLCCECELAAWEAEGLAATHRSLENWGK